MPTNLTDSVVASTKTHAGRLELRDTKVRGLALRVTPNGIKTWSCQFYIRDNGRTGRVTIGPYPAVSLADARKRAREILAEVAAGFDPSAAKRERSERITFARALDMFIEQYCRPRLDTAEEIARSLKKDLLPSLGARALADITRRDLATVIAKVTARGSSTMANRVLERTRRFFRWCVSQGLIDHAPTEGLVKENDEVARDRILSPEEIKSLWVGLTNAPMSEAIRRAIRLALITGQRRSEVTGMTLKELDLKERIWVLPSERTKNEQQHVVTLSLLAVSTIEEAIKATKGSPFVFPSPRGDKPIDGHAVSTAMRRLQRTLVFDPPIRTHDLRRTVATQLAELGVAESVIARTLNQITGYSSVTAKHYNKHSYIPEKRAALDLWAARLEAIVKDPEALPIPKV